MDGLQFAIHNLVLSDLPFRCFWLRHHQWVPGILHNRIYSDNIWPLKYMHAVPGEYMMPQSMEIVPNMWNLRNMVLGLGEFFIYNATVCWRLCTPAVPKIVHSCSRKSFLGLYPFRNDGIHDFEALTKDVWDLSALSRRKTMSGIYGRGRRPSHRANLFQNVPKGSRLSA